MSDDFHIANQVEKHFPFLFRDFGYRIIKKGVDHKTFGNQVARLESEFIFVDFILDRRDTGISVMFRHKDSSDEYIWLSSIYKFLTYDLSWSFSGNPEYIPKPFIAGEQNITDWQIKRLSDLTEVMWLEIEETVTPNSKLNQEYRLFNKERDEYYWKHRDEIHDLYKLVSKYIPENRNELKFEDAVKNSFGFLVDQHDFVLLQPSVLFSRFESRKNPKIYINVFHSLKMYRLGIHSGIQHNLFEKDYALDEFSKLMGLTLKPWPIISDTPTLVVDGVSSLSELFKSLCEPVIKQDLTIFERLQTQRINYAYELRDNWIRTKKHNLRTT